MKKTLLTLSLLTILAGCANTVKEVTSVEENVVQADAIDPVTGLKIDGTDG